MADDRTTQQRMRHMPALVLATTLLVGALPISRAEAFSLRSTVDSSRPTGWSMDRSRTPGFVDFATRSARRAEERRLRALAEEIARAWQTARWRATAAPEPATTVAARPAPAIQPRWQRHIRSLPARAKIIRLGDYSAPPTQVYRGVPLRPGQHLHLRPAATSAVPVWQVAPASAQS